MTYISYDPNYNYDDDENDDEDMEMDNDVDDDGASEEDYSDDDDMSWKVRRASAKALEAVILTRLDLLEEFYKVISPIIIGQFKGLYFGSFLFCMKLTHFFRRTRRKCQS